ncbi:MAG TPA: helix-turn-helix domain-containing protein [Blastocatellia bacterium]|nr:helix-turn-helix domain-containing protein [Blastocatellia bacterium]
MNSPRIILEPQFSVEQRPLSRRVSELSAQSGYLLIHLLSSRIEGLPSSASLLLNPNQTIRFSSGRQRSELLLVRLTPQLLVEAAARLRLHCTGANLLFRQPLTPITDDPNLCAALEAMDREIDEAAAGWREVIRSLVGQMAVYLLRSHINVQRSDEIELSRVGIVDRRLRRAIEFMHDNCERELGLSEIAAAAYLSAFHFARLFKKITGTTPHAYLATLRIEKARRMLAETDLSIIEIGARVGYTSQSHFTKIFREATGLTPRVFRAAATGSN